MLVKLKMALARCIQLNGFVIRFLEAVTIDDECNDLAVRYRLMCQTRIKLSNGEVVSAGDVIAKRYNKKVEIYNRKRMCLMPKRKFIKHT